MAQLDMVPEEVQFYSKDLTDTVKEMVELYKRLEQNLKELDEAWTSHEKTAYLSVVREDMKKMDKLLVSIYSFGETALDIANNRIERENAAVNAVSGM